jgi:hypothetical protein
VRCALEWTTTQALYRRVETAPTANVTQYLAGHLGDDLLSAEQHRLHATPVPLGPATLLLALCPACVVDPKSLAHAAARLLRTRLSWRRVALRQLHVCVTWHGAVTDVSTANRAGSCLELPLALVCPGCARACCFAALVCAPHSDPMAYRRCRTPCSSSSWRAWAWLMSLRNAGWQCCPMLARTNGRAAGLWEATLCREPWRNGGHCMGLWRACRTFAVACAAPQTL